MTSIIHVDLAKKVRIVAWKNMYVHSEEKLGSFNKDSDVGKFVYSKEYEIENKGSRIRMQSLDAEVSLDLQIDKNFGTSNFLEAFTIIQFAKTKFEFDELGIPNTFKFKIGHISQDFELLEVTQSDLPETIFSLPPKIITHDGPVDDIFEKRKRKKHKNR